MIEDNNHHNQEQDQGHGSHSNDHDHPNQKKVINRLARITGHTAAIKRMVEESRDCSEILIQIAAVKSALTNVGKLILDDHINHCVVKAVKEDDTQSLEDLRDAIDKFVK